MTAALTHSDTSALDHENERLRAEMLVLRGELRDSRTSLFNAADAERIRIERNLHDGALQHLLAIRMKLRRVQTAACREESSFEEQLGEAIADLDQASSDLRELARGLHPAILVDQGIAAAIEALAQRVPIEVILLNLSAERIPTAIEATAYFIVAEAVANVMRHAQASRIVISVDNNNDSLIVEVTDDGVGGADTNRGTGIRGLQDRVALFNGSLTLVSPIGAGTMLRATLGWPRPELKAIRG